MAVLWLLQRFYTLTRVPVDDLVKTLKIDIPKASKLSIDNITSSKVYLHWDLPAVEQKIVNFCVYLNATQVAMLSGTESHCCVSGLEPNTRYKLDLVCINNTGYKAKSDSVYIKSNSTELQNHLNPLLLENPDNLFKYLTGSKDSSNVEKLVTPFSVNPNVEGRASRSRSNTVNSLNNDNSLNLTSNASTYAELPDPTSIENIEELRYYLESGQEELHTILLQQAQTYRDFKDYEATLIQERDSLRERKKLEDGNRQSMKSEIKMLDDTRRLTELRKTKQEGVLSDKLKNIEKMEADLKTWNAKIDEFHAKRSEMEQNEPTIIRAIQVDIEDKQIKIKTLAEDISKLDENIKSLNSNRKQQENLVGFPKLFKKLANHTDENGLVDNEGTKALESIRLLDAETYSQVKSSLDLDNKMEAEWRAQQQREVSRCQRLTEAYKSLSAENQLMKDDSLNSQAWDKLPSAPQSSAINDSIPIPQYGTNDYQLPLSSPPVVSTLNYNFHSNSSNSLAAQAPQFNQISSSIWNNVQNPSERQRMHALQTSNLTDFHPSDVESPSANHYLPSNLIGEDLSDYLFNKKRESVVQSGSSQDIPNSGSDNRSVMLNTYSSNSAHQFSKTLNDSNANLSTKSLFHADFDLASMSPPEKEPSSQHLFNPVSPQLSYQNDFMSMHNSPNTSLNMNVNDIHSILSGANQNEIMAPMNLTSPPSSLSQSPTAVHTELHPPNGKKENAFNPFSPRRLSNVFSFGKKNNESNDFILHPTLSPPTTASSIPTSKSKKQSKFFNNSRATQSIDLTSERNQPNNNPPHFFNFNNHHNGNAKISDEPTSTLSKPANNDEFLNSVWETAHLKAHERHVSLHSTNSLEKDNISWSNFHNNSPNGSPLPLAGSTTDTDRDESLLVPVELVNTNKSVKSSNESQLSSPSFFKRKNFFSFGNSNNNNEKSPTKGVNSPSDIDQELESVEEFNPNQTSASNVSMKLFSRTNRKSSMISQNRKQSNSSSFQDSQNDSYNDNTSSNHSGRSGSIVKKLNFFKNGKDINDIEEAIED
jgi:hypothetical protein